MRRITLSRKTMEWICHILKEASNDNRNLVRRWRTQDQAIEFYGTKKYNEHGRYIGFLSLKGGVREVIIVLELAINAGWRDIALKIENFINANHQCMVNQPSEQTLSYASAVESSKWQRQDQIESSENPKGPLGRSITGIFRGGESPTLADARRWASSTWKKAFGVNIYEMAVHTFLFEFPNKHMTEQIVQREWIWRKLMVQLQWWTSLIGCISAQHKRESTWIRAMGLPLHLWFNETFQEIGDRCGGWLRIEEETELRNHLKWARIEVKRRRQ
ncbi:hypothetical protein FXO37_25838 [Capsicum annuum]|nr:hypothetical protein FXO37_25838 [Capsicum annuum]